MKEQRRYSRKRLRVRGCYQDRDGKVFKGIVQNISLGGVYIETPWPLDRGENINLSIDAGDVGKVIGVEGRVVRNMPEKGMGIEFTDQNNEDIRPGRLSLMDDDHSTDPVGRITIHALPHLGAGDVNVEPPCVQGGGHILYPLDPFLNILNNLIVASNEDDLSRAKID